MEFRILGPLEVLGEGRLVVLAGDRQRALLALLAIHANRVLSTEWLIDELWGERPPATAAKTLQAHVSRLRKALRRVGDGAGDGVVVTREHGYELRVDRECVDALRFERLIGEARDELGAGRMARSAILLEEALSLWRGPPLAEFADEGFVAVEIARLEELRIGALEDLIEARLALGRHVTVVGELELLISQHPYRERLRSQLMLALYRSDRQAEALQAYQDARRKLVEELGIEPGERLRELERAILAQDPALALIERESAVIRPAPDASRGAFVGRERELGELVACLDDAVAGSGRLVLLAGEPGIGKSRLAEELIARAEERGARVLVGRCWEAGGAPAYWPWLQSLRTYVRERGTESLRSELAAGAPDLAQFIPELRERFPDLEAPPTRDPDGARFRLFDATAEFLRNASNQRPLMLVLDDVQAADAPSLLLLRFLARELGSIQALVLVLYRDVDPVPGAPLSEMIAEVAREHVTHRLTLTGLSERQVGQYLQLTGLELASPELAGILHAQTEGNPLFVGEIVRLLASDGGSRASGDAGVLIPRTVRDVIVRRLAHLSSDCRRLLALASVLGREFDLGSLARLAEMTVDAMLDTLEEAIAARVVGVVPGAGDRLRFTHVLIRDTLYDGLARTGRVRLHRQVVAALEALYGDQPGPHLAELAHHAAAARDFGKAIDYAKRAADRSLALLAYEEAGRLYQTALDALELGRPGEADIRCELLLSLGDAQARAGDSAAAQTTFLNAAAHARQLGLGRELARAAAGYGGRIVWARAGQDARLTPLLESGLAALSDQDLELRVRLLARLAGALRDEPSIRRREAMSREAVELARRTRDPNVLAYALDSCGSIIGGRPGTDAEQTALADELLRLAERAGDRERVVSAHYQKFIAAIVIGDVGTAEAALTAATTVAEELRQPTQLWQVRAARVMLTLAAGSLSDAEELMGQALELGERAQRGIAIPTHTLHCLTLRDLQGRLVEIEPTIRAAVIEYPTQPVYRCALIYLHARLRQAADARRALAELSRDDFAALPRDNEWLYGTSLLSEACALLHDAETARILYRLLAPYAKYNVVDTPDAIRGSVSRYLGLLATTTARWEDADTHFKHALALNAQMKFVPWLAHTQHDHARMLLSHGAATERNRALDLIKAAIATYNKLEMRRWARMASDVEHALRHTKAAGR